MRDFYEKIIEKIVFASFVLLILTVTYQIFSRIFFPRFSQIWTEELTRFLFIYAVTFAAALAMKDKQFVSLSLFDGAPKKVRLVIGTIVNCISLSVFAVIFFHGIKFSLLGLTQRAPTMNVPIFVVYITIPLMGLNMMIYLVVNTVREFLTFKGAGK